MKFTKNQYNRKTTTIGQPMDKVPCDEFVPGQARTIKQIMEDFVSGVPLNEDPNPHRITDPEEADKLVAYRGIRHSALDNARAAAYLHEYANELESKLTTEEINFAKANK